jgi:hypothetical protein
MNEYINDILTNINGHLLRLQKIPAELLCVKNIAPEVDGYIKVFEKKRQFDVKKNLMPGRMVFICRQLIDRNAILFADYVPPTIAEMLIQQDIEYADQAGNMFLKDADNCILIQNCAKPKNIEAKNAQGRAWTPTGLKVIFLLLTEPAALNWAYRKISKYAGVSLGSVKYVMSDLQERQLLVKIQDVLRFGDLNKLREFWVAAYVEKLFNKSPVKLYKGKLDVPIDNYPAVLTGETAAADLNMIKTDRICLYQCGNINELITRKRWKLDDTGNIEIRTAFWPEIRNFKHAVPYLLVYADLIAENDGRCLEVAKLIYDRYLKEEH